MKQTYKQLKKRQELVGISGLPDMTLLFHMFSFGFPCLLFFQFCICHQILSDKRRVFFYAEKRRKEVEQELIKTGEVNEQNSNEDKK